MGCAQANFLPVNSLKDKVGRGPPFGDDGPYDGLYGQWLMDTIYTELAQVGGDTTAGTCILT